MSRAAGKHLRNPERAETAAALAQRYAAGESIRQLASATGYSYGLVHDLLVDAGVVFRSRGARSSGARSSGGQR